MLAYFKEEQDMQALGRVKNIITHINAGVPMDDLAQRFFDRALTEHDKALMRRLPVLDEIRKSRVLTRVPGPYYPLMRQGGYAS